LERHTLRSTARLSAWERAQVGQKRPRDAGEDACFKAAALDAVKAFLKDFAAVPAAELADADVDARVAALKAGLQERANENPVLRGMLAASAR
jgi:hypothetical protein